MEDLCANIILKYIQRKNNMVGDEVFVSEKEKNLLLPFA
jgi:hypothetical protein